METLKANNRIYKIAAKTKGSLSNKWNRAAKLIAQFDELDTKFRGIVERGAVQQSELHRCALACLLMMHTGVRVGNESSAEGYMTKPHPNQKDKVPEFVKTYGLTTMLAEHVTIKSTNKCVISFSGKKQIENNFVISDKFLVVHMAALKLTNDIPLFGVTDYQITKFIKKYVGKAYSPKDFRCMRGNMYAWEFAATAKRNSMTTKKQFKAFSKELFEFVSTKLNNTPSVCRKAYVVDQLIPSLESFLICKN